MASVLSWACVWRNVTTAKNAISEERCWTHHLRPVGQVHHIRRLVDAHNAVLRAGRLGRIATSMAQTDRHSEISERLAALTK